MGGSRAFTSVPRRSTKTLTRASGRAVRWPFGSDRGGASAAGASPERAGA